MSSTSVPRYPLAWPEGWPRRKHSARSSRFQVTHDRALKDLSTEIERLGGRYAVLSTNVELRLDGTTTGGWEPRDPGVAVYFELKGTQKVFACDTFTTVTSNIRAISLTINAFRALDRFGASGLLERALTGFDALPAPTSHWEILGVKKGASQDEIGAAFRARAKEAHSDVGGSDGRMRALIAARQAALIETTGKDK